VGAFEFLWQIHEHPDDGNGVLHSTGFVAHLDRKAQPPDADLIDAKIAMIAFALLIVEFGMRSARAIHTRRAGLT